jgi:single-strand DNA-binding protein
MSNPTYVKLTGWVTKDPNLRKTNGDQTPVCTIRVGAASRWPDRTTGEWREGPASYFDVVCWRGLAVNVAASVRKGHMITIHGTFRNRDWTDKDNNARTSLEITASSVGHELTYGWTHFNRTTRASSQSAEQLADGEINRVIEAGPDGDDGQGEENPFRDAFGQPESGPATDPAYEPDGERVFGAADDAGPDDGGSDEAAVGDPLRAEVPVPA